MSRVGGDGEGDKNSRQPLVPEIYGAAVIGGF